MPDKPATIVILADAMFTSTARDEKPAPGGVAIEGSKIVAVGTKDEVKAYIGEDTIVKEYGADKLLIPALIDAHLHLENTILCECGPELRFVESEEECVANARAWYEKNPDAAWVIGFGWHQANWPGCKVPDKKLLTEALPDVPAFLMDIDTHCAWVNQKALDELGITADTPDPVGGRIWRYENGEPSGYLEESAAIDTEPLVLDKAFSSDEIRKQKLAETIALFNRRGFTSTFDAFDTPANWYRALEDLRAEDNLNLRLSTSVLINSCDDYIERSRELAEKYPDKEAPITFWGCKVLADGVGGAHTAWMTDPYADDPSTSGDCLLPPEVMMDKVLKCQEAGFPVHVHACGTRAVEYALDIFEEAEKRGIKHDRNSITHCDTVNAKDFPRFRELGITAALQPDMMAPTPRYESDFYHVYFGEKVYELAWANRTMFDNCDYISFSSDSPVGFAARLDQIFRATQRVFNDGKPAGGVHPEQKITVSEALWAFTYGGAYQLMKDDIIGSLEVGKRADIAVLDHNLFTCDPSEIKGTESALTLFDGRIVHEA